MTATEALAGAMTMLEEISRGKTYPPNEYHRRLRKFRRTLEACDPKGFEEWMRAMGYYD